MKECLLALGEDEMTFDFPVETIREGKATLVVPQLKAFKRTIEDYAPSRAPVFYNPVMKLNRDIAILALQAYRRTISHDIDVAEPLSGCGVRGIRFAEEVEEIGNVFANDINPEAFKMTQHNIKLNDLIGRVLASNEDANLFLSRFAAPRKRFDCVDVDPFGSPVPYLDSAVRATRDGGLIALTSTDLAPLCGVYPKSALRKYGGLSLKTEYCHEIAVRLLVGCLSTATAKHDVGINVLFSHSTDHYIRVYASTRYGAKKADQSIQNMGCICHCFICFHREIGCRVDSPSKQQCSECGSPMKTAGPLWLGRIADRRFCELMEKEAFLRENEDKHNILRILSSVKMEADGPVTYYVVDKICDKMSLPVPPLKRVISALKEEDFCVMPTHFHSRGIRTDAPAKTVVDATRKIAGPS